MKVHGFVCFLLSLVLVNSSYGLDASELAGVYEADRQLVLQLTKELKEANDGEFSFKIKKIGGNVKRVGEDWGIDRFQSSTSNKYTYEYASYRNSLLIDNDNKLIGINIKNNNLRDLSTINKFKHLKYLFIDSHKENMANVIVGDNLNTLKELTIRDSGVEKLNIKTTLSNLT